jgi:WD repeat-containing protein 61
MVFSKSKGMEFEVVKIRDFVGHTQAVYGFDFLSDKQSVLSVSGDGLLVEWQLNENDGIVLMKHQKALYSVKAYNSFYFVGSQDGFLFVYDANDSKIIHSFQFNAGAIFDILLFNNQYFIATENGSVYVLDANFNAINSQKVAQKAIRQLVIVENCIAAASSDASCYFLDMELNVLSQSKFHNSSVFSLAYNANEMILYSAGRDAQIALERQNLLVNKIKAHLLHIHGLSINQELELLLSCSMDKSIKVWDLKTMNLLKVIHKDKGLGHDSSVNKILWIDKNTFISCSDDRTLKCFEIKEK